MKARDLISLALSRLGTSRLRTALTMLGVIIGVASVVALVAVGQGSTANITDRLTGLGTNLLTINPGSTQTAGTFGAAGSAETLTLADAEALEGLDRAGRRRAGELDLTARHRSAKPTPRRPSWAPRRTTRPCAASSSGRAPG